MRAAVAPSARVLAAALGDGGAAATGAASGRGAACVAAPARLPARGLPTPARTGPPRFNRGAATLKGGCARGAPMRAILCTFLLAATLMSGCSDSTAGVELSAREALEV